MPNINLRLSDEEHEALRKWAFEGRRSIQREIIFRLFSSEAAVGYTAESGSAVSYRASEPERAASDSKPKNYHSEPFSLVCKSRADHEPGVYCPECKGDGGR